MSHGASVHASADDAAAQAEAAAWARLSADTDAGERLASWLALMSAQIARTRAALLLTREPGGEAFTVAAAWPDARRDLQYLAPVAELALQQREGVVLAPGAAQPPGPDGAAHVGYPVEVGGLLCAAVVLDIGPGPRAALQLALRQLHWGAAWLNDHFRSAQLTESERRRQRSEQLGELMATAMQHAQLEPSALAVSHELVRLLACDRVSVGFEQQGRVQPRVMSHTASFDPRSDLVRWIGEAMDEALDLGLPVSHPTAADEPLAALAHAESARQLGVTALLSVPVREQGRTLGVITFERAAPFGPAERDLAAAAGVLLGPYWALQAERERSLPARVRDAVLGAVRELSGPRHPGLKLVGATLGLFLLVSALWVTDHRISARTVVEGTVQIAAVAPFDGFVAEGLVRAGDTVKKAQPLARLDDRDLRLERSRWAAERGQLRRRYEVAEAQGDRAAMGVLAAQVHQAESQLALADERLARATVIAPFDGLIVSGDLSQQIGSPVETGRLLFEVAPLQGFRVMMQVDDRDIALLRQGQSGELVLSGLPDRAFALQVERITPVATPRDGRNVFAVEARIEPGAVLPLRPGMEGVAKVTVGERSLLWIWTRGLVEWTRLALWNVLP